MRVQVTVVPRSCENKRFKTHDVKRKGLSTNDLQIKVNTDSRHLMTVHFYVSQYRQLRRDLTTQETPRLWVAQ